MEARRPARARKAVTHYSDDNPSTFTVKRGKYDLASDPPEPLEAKQEARAKRRDKRAAAVLRRGSSSSLTSTAAAVAASRPSATASAAVTPNSSTPATPAASKTKPLPSNRRTSSTASANSDATPPGRRKRPREEDNHHTRSHAAQSKQQNNHKDQQQTNNTPPPADEIIAHRVNIQPVLRPKPTTSHHQRKAHARTPLQQLAAHARWNWPTPKPHGWKIIPTADKEHTLFANSESEQVVSLPPAAITAMARHDPLSPYWLAGDAAGKVIVFDVRTGRPVRTIQTKATHREANRVMTSKTVISYPNLIAAIAGRQDTVVVWTAHELQALTLSTAQNIWTVDLECQTGPNANHRDQVTAAAAATQCLDVHANQPRLLWQKPKAITPLTKHETQTDNRDLDTATLYLIEWGGAKQQHCNNFSQSDKVNHGDEHNHLHYSLQWTAIAPHDTSHAVAWDVHNTDALLQVATTKKDETWELRRIHVPSQKILDKTVLHNQPASGGLGGAGSGSANQHHLYAGCRVQQAADYLFLCTNRGIRCFDKQRFTFLTVYGETVALHGKTVGWQDCFWMPEPSWPHTVWQDVGTSSRDASGSTGKTTLASLAKAGSGALAAAGGALTSAPSCVLSTRDELARRRAITNALLHNNGNQGSETSAVQSSSPNKGAASPATPTGSGGHSSNLFSNMLLVGVPHPHRGPTELQSTLYVWKPGQVLPLTTLQAPSGGLLGLIAKASPTLGWQLTCATASHGQAWELRAGLQSDFPGNMYPTHFQVINDNVEYIEDEDELDKTSANGSIAVAGSTSADEEDDEVLQRALKESLEDDDAKIDVLHDEDDAENTNPFCSFVPAWPDPSLRPQSSKSSASQQQSPSRFREKAEPELFAGFPQLNAVRQARSEVREHSRRNSLNSTSSTFGTAATAQPSSAASSDLVESDKGGGLLKVSSKGKRSRATNIEVLMQGSIDPKLRQEMMELHKKWSDGKGTRMPPLPDRTKDEQTVAAEPLLGHDSVTSTPTPDATGIAPSGHAGENGSASLTDPPAPRRIASVSDGDALAAPPTAVPNANVTTSITCMACLGRMVIHACGKRAKPVDHDALAQAEAERKAAEEAEKQRIKTEKRRAAEAKRREARKKRKEEEERKRREEELQRLEEERVAAMQRAAVASPVEDSTTYAYEPPRKIPRYAELMSSPVTTKGENEYTFGYAHAPVAATAAAAPATSVTQNNEAREGYARQTSSNVSEESVYSSSSFTAAAVEPLFKPEDTTPLDEPTYRTAVSSYSSVAAAIPKPTSAENDALAVLAGLADMSAQAPSSFSSDADGRNYGYSGADDRRRAILNEFHSLHAQAATTQPGQGGHSVYDRAVSTSEGHQYSYVATSSPATNETETDRPGNFSNGGGLLYFNHKSQPDDSR